MPAPFLQPQCEPQRPAARAAGSAGILAGECEPGPGAGREAGAAGAGRDAGAPGGRGRLAVAALGLVCWALLGGGCGAPGRQAMLHVLFTGVDAASGPPGAAAGAKGTNAVAAAGAKGTNMITAVIGPAARPALYVHTPYAEHKCSACHVAGQAQELHAKDGELCLECHSKLIGAAKFVHPPVDDGKCHLCHTSHQSTERFLLTRKAEELCFGCHKLPKLEKVKQHATLATTECLSCHDPHRSDLKKLLKAQS